MALFQNSGRYKIKCVGSNINFLKSYKNQDDDDSGGCDDDDDDDIICIQS